MYKTHGRRHILHFVSSFDGDPSKFSSNMEYVAESIIVEDMILVIPAREGVKVWIMLLH